MGDPTIHENLRCDTIFDITITDSTEKMKCVLASQLNALVQKNQVISVMFISIFFLVFALNFGKHCSDNVYESLFTWRVISFHVLPRNQGYSVPYSHFLVIFFVA